MNAKQFIEKSLQYDESFNLRDKKDVHPSHLVALIDIKELRDWFFSRQKEIDDDIIKAIEKRKIKKSKLKHNLRIRWQSIAWREFLEGLK